MVIIIWPVITISPISLIIVVSLCWAFAESYQFTVPESLPVASVVAKIKATDPDVGPNAEMEYRVIDGDGLAMFRVTPDKDTQEGVIALQRVRQLHITSDIVFLCKIDASSFLTVQFIPSVHKSILPANCHFSLVNREAKIHQRFC